MKRFSRVFSGNPKAVDSRELTEVAISQNTKSIIEGRSVDESRSIRVVIIGAGISGILACIRLVQRIENLELCIYDKNADIGGTWFENRYPGCACGMLSTQNQMNLLLTKSPIPRYSCTHLPSYL